MPAESNLEAAQVTAIQFRHQPIARPRASGAAALVVGWRDGSRLSASTLVADARQARLTLAGSRRRAVTLSAETAAITALQTLGGQAVYLSDLKPVGYKHIPFLQLAWPYQADRNVSGDLLRAGGKLFLKGLGMHSASRLTYDLDRPASRLEAALAIDDRAGGRGSVVFRVFVDTGDGHWEPKFTSPIVRGGDRAAADRGRRGGGQADQSAGRVCRPGRSARLRRLARCPLDSLTSQPARGSPTRMPPRADACPGSRRRSARERELPRSHASNGACAVCRAASDAAERVSSGRFG